jgi:tight adherence protein C
MWEFLILALIFLFAFILFLWVWAGINRKRQRIEDRLQTRRSDPMLSSDPLAPSTPELVLGQEMTPALAGTLPMGTEDRGDLQRELRAAGYYKPTALMEYAALRAVFILGPLVGAAILMLFTDQVSDLWWIWGGGILLAILGFSLPRVYLYLRAKARQHQIERGLPTAIDMLTLCLSAGLNVLNSLERVTMELRFAYPVLGEELQIVRRQSELRSLEFALIQFAERTGMPQIRNLTVLLTQSENLGTDAVSVLREYADDLRINMRQRADEMANKAPFKLLFPAYLMAFGAGILLISPAVLEFQNFRHHNLLTNELEQGRYFLENKDKILQEYNNPTVPEDAEYNFPKSWYKRRGNRPTQAERAQKIMEGGMFDEPTGKSKKRQMIPTFTPKKQEEKK